MRIIDEKVVHVAKEKGTELDAFIKQYEFYILKCASKSSKRYITRSDDEWSVALIAFSQAIDTYKIERGSFFAYAEMLIHNSLVDFFRFQGRFLPEIQHEFKEEDAIVKNDKDYIKLEIEAISQTLSQYGFDFMDLTDNSPKAGKTKESCAKAIRFMLDKPILIQQMQNQKLLPLKIIENNSKVPRKILERHRKYIIAAVEILIGDYPYLSEYLQTYRKEAK